MKKLWDIFYKGIFNENPIFVLALSLCPALAVTSTVLNALTMGLTVMFVITANNVVVSLNRKFVNPKVRVPVYIVYIATIVTFAQLILEAFAPVLYKSLGLYLSLVVVFAIILARAEVFASKNSVSHSFFDGLGMGCGFTLSMVVIGAIRELLGSGSLLGVQILGSWYNAPLIMILPAGAFITIGYLIGFTKLYSENKKKKLKERDV